jgi:LysR family transcriptional regulator, regulator for bpeEF and oprC
MKDLNSLRVFVRVAQLKSFKAAAVSLGLTSSAISKAVTRLEADIGVTLLQRTTRSVGLTDDGAVFFANCQQILGEIERAETLLSRATAGPYGRLRVHMTEGLGRRVVMPTIGTFLEQNPSITVSAELSDRVVDFANEGFDIDIQIGEMADSRLIARRLGAVSFVVCASPDYLARHGEPRTPAELDRHNCLAYARMHTGRLREWQFQEHGSTYRKLVSGALSANNSEALLVAAISGAGIAMVSNFIAAESIAAGKVKPILTRYTAPGPPVFAVYLRAQNISPKIRAFVDFLAVNTAILRTPETPAKGPKPLRRVKSVAAAPAPRPVTGWS